MNDKLENAYVNIEQFVLEHSSTDEWNEFVEYIQLVQKAVKALEILKAFGFEIEDYTENEHGSIKVKHNRIIVDDEEIDIAKEVLL